MSIDELPRVSVLLVDDREESLITLESILEPLGQHLVRASSGAAALRAVLDQQFAVILMDPIAEDTGLGQPIARWVLDEACRRLAAWRDASVGVDVNLTTRQFTHPSLAADLASAIARANIDPTRLRLAITESTMLARGSIAADMLAQLRDLGVSLCLDDFGTGDTCLAYLTELPVTAIKIDRSFVARIGMPNERPEVLHAIVALAHNLGIEVTAQGVERADQLLRLCQLECETAQGYYFAHPLDAHGADELLRGAIAIPA